MSTYPSTEENTLWGENYSIRSATGVNKFHAAGYYGERVKAATGENWDLRNYNPDGLVEIPFGNGVGWGNYSGGHGSKTAATFFQVAPKTVLYQMPKIFSHRLSSDPTRFKCGFITDCYPIIKEEGITSIFCSFEMITDKHHDDELTEALDDLKTFTFILSAGNDYSSEYNELMECEAVFGIGACYILGSKPRPEEFSSVYAGVDFCAPDRQTVKFAKETGVIEYGKQSGTSFSAPWFQGMCCLVNDYAIDKAGRPLDYKDMYRFMADHCIDVGDVGVDDKCGHGMPVLPEPAEIKLEDYIPSSVDTPIAPPAVDQDSEEESTVSKQPEQIRENYKPYETHILASEFNFDEDWCQVTIVPYQSIKEVGFAQCAQPKEAVMSWYSRQEDKPQIVTNGGLFNMSTGTNILSFVDEGEEQNYKGNFEGIGVLADNLASLIPGNDSEKNWKDFMSAYPVLVRKGKALTTFDKGNELNYYAARTAIGVTKTGDVIILTVDKPGAQGGMLFAKMADIFEEYGAWYAVNLDGGGSVYKLEFGKVANDPTEARMIDNVFYVKLKEASDMSTNPSVNLDPVVVSPGTYYAQEPIELKSGVDQSEDNPSRVIATIGRGEQLTINSTMQWIGKTWGITNYNYQMGFIVCTGTNFGEIPPLPAVFATEEGAMVIADRYEESDGVAQYHIVCKAFTSGTGYTLGDKIDTMLQAATLDFVECYEGTLIDESEDVDDDSQDVINPGEGSGEGDPEEPEFDDFPAKYMVNPNMVNTVLNVRSAPINGSVITTIKPGHIVNVLTVEADGEWAKVEYNDAGDIGYCSMAYLIYCDEESDENDTSEAPTKDDNSMSEVDKEIWSRISNRESLILKTTKDTIGIYDSTVDGLITETSNIPCGTTLLAYGTCYYEQNNYVLTFNKNFAKTPTLVKLDGGLEIMDVIAEPKAEEMSGKPVIKLIKMNDVARLYIKGYEDIVGKELCDVRFKFGVLMGTEVVDGVKYGIVYGDDGYYYIAPENYKIVGEIYEIEDKADGADDDSNTMTPISYVADADDISADCVDAVDFVVSADLMPLDDKKMFYPDSNVTKEELAKILYNLCADLDDM